MDSNSIIDARRLLDLAESSGSDKDKCLRMLELARMLVQGAGPGDRELKAVAGTAVLTDFFLEYQDLARSCNAFLGKALPHLEDELKGQEFEKRLQQLDRDISELVKKGDELKPSLEALSAREDELRRADKDVKEMQGKLQELRELERRVSPENIARLKEEIEQLKESTLARVPELEQLEQEHARLKEASEEVERSLNALEQEDDTGRLLAMSARLHAALEEKWSEHDEKLEQERRKLKVRTSEFEKITTRLDDCIRNLEEVTRGLEGKNRIYNAHFAANTHIGRFFVRDDATGQDLKNGLRELESRIDAQLRELDLLLRDAIDAKEAEVKRVRELIKPTGAG